MLSNHHLEGLANSPCVDISCFGTLMGSEAKMEVTSSKWSYQMAFKIIWESKCQGLSEDLKLVFVASNQNRGSSRNG